MFLSFARAKIKNVRQFSQAISENNRLLENLKENKLNWNKYRIRKLYFPDTKPEELGVKENNLPEREHLSRALYDIIKLNDGELNFSQLAEEARKQFTGFDLPTKMIRVQLRYLQVDDQIKVVNKEPRYIYKVNLPYKKYVPLKTYLEQLGYDLSKLRKYDMTKVQFPKPKKIVIKKFKREQLQHQKQNPNDLQRRKYFYHERS